MRVRGHAPRRRARNAPGDVRRSYGSADPGSWRTVKDTGGTRGTEADGAGHSCRCRRLASGEAARYHRSCAVLRVSPPPRVSTWGGGPSGDRACGRRSADGRDTTKEALPMSDTPTPSRDVVIVRSLAALRAEVERGERARAAARRSDRDRVLSATRRAHGLLTPAFAIVGARLVAARSVAARCAPRRDRPQSRRPRRHLVASRAASARAPGDPASRRRWRASSIGAAR